MSEKRRPSIFNTPTPLQIEAWQAEHAAIEVEKSGYSAFKSYHLDIARDLRQTDTHNKITELFARSDDQNAIIDLGLSLQSEGKPLPIITGKVEEMQPSVDYQLMQQ